MDLVCGLDEQYSMSVIARYVGQRLLHLSLVQERATELIQPGMGIQHHLVLITNLK
jgi:hypothetical protein